MYHCPEKHIIFFGTAVLFTAFFCSCSTVKKVPEGSYLLRKNEVVVSPGSRVLSVDELQSYIRQRPNRSDMFKFHLRLYGMSGKDTSKWVNRKLQEWGEAPVIFDSAMTSYSVDNIKAYLRNLGLYHATVKDSVVYAKKRATVFYKINPGSSYIIRDIKYDIADTAIRKLVVSDTARLRVGRRLSASMLDREREIIAGRLRNNGYYTFNKSFITFRADSSMKDMGVGLRLIIPAFVKMESGGKIETAYPVYRINNIYFYTNYNSLLAVTDSTYTKTFDTLQYDDIYLLYKGHKNLKQGVLSRVNLFEKGDIYSEDKVQKTHNNLSGLALFKSVTIQFREAGEELLDCLILLDPLMIQSYEVDIELSTNASNMIGFSPGISYRHKNLFKGAEVFNLDFRGVFQRSFGPSHLSSQEYNGGLSFDIPRFLMPVSIGYFKTQVPHTQFSTSYIYQQRPDYTRAIGNFRFGYRWKSSPTKTFQFNLLDFNMIKMYELSSEFYASINNPYLKNMYSNHFILGMTGTFIYSNQPESRRRRRRREGFWNYRINGDVAGNFLSFFNRTMRKDGELGRLVAGMPYSQYVKGDMNLVYDHPVGVASSTVYRFYFGIGQAYGNSLSMPFEKLFYAGGANSLRGWQVRSVGPGSVSSDSIDVFPNQVADLRLEMNVEYRFPLFWKFEGALFVDAGNVWSLSSKDTREGARFGFNRFYREIALNSGLGLRLNFDYFILRFDAGFKIHNPGLPSGNRVIMPDKWFEKDNFNLHFGINYPFNY
ncbi:MAG: BamA/TamA family outer membrane protein [Prevotellaceae bacterium]|jgi:outer membrane protein assembly factor BamA|nr:BamA/TamA family outer membrane protein [Prevotellaceae bacterium]